MDALLPHWLQVYVLLSVGIGSSDVGRLCLVALRIPDLLYSILPVHLAYLCVIANESICNTRASIHSSISKCNQPVWLIFWMYSTKLMCLSSSFFFAWHWRIFLESYWHISHLLLYRFYRMFRIIASHKAISSTWYLVGIKSFRGPPLIFY